MAKATTHSRGKKKLQDVIESIPEVAAATPEPAAADAMPAPTNGDSGFVATESLPPEADEARDAPDAAPATVAEAPAEDEAKHKGRRQKQDHACD